MCSHPLTYIHNTHISLTHTHSLAHSLSLLLTHTLSHTHSLTLSHTDTLSFPPPPPLSLQIDYESFTKVSERLTIQECKLSMKWVGEEENKDQVPSDLHYNISFTGSHQRKSTSYIHLHARYSQGKCEAHIHTYLKE